MQGFKALTNGVVRTAKAASPMRMSLIHKTGRVVHRVRLCVVCSCWRACVRATAAAQCSRARTKAYASNMSDVEWQVVVRAALVHELAVVLVPLAWEQPAPLALLAAHELGIGQVKVPLLNIAQLAARGCRAAGAPRAARRPRTHHSMGPAGIR